MNMICQIFVLALIMGVVWYLGYRKGKNIREREYAEMEEPTFNKTKLENDNPKYQQFYNLFDQMMTDDDFFTGDISKSAGTCTNKDEKQK